MILCVLLVLLILISVFGGSIRYPTDTFTANKVLDELKPAVATAKPVAKPVSTKTTAPIAPSKPTADAPAGIEAFQGDEFALVPGAA